MSPLVLKMTHHSTTRRIPLPFPPSSNWAALATLLSQRFSLPPSKSDLVLKWKDEEGDSITISSQQEWNELLESLPEGVTTLRLEIVHPSAAPSSYIPTEAASASDLAGAPPLAAPSSESPSLSEPNSNLSSSSNILVDYSTIPAAHLEHWRTCEPVKVHWDSRPSNLFQAEAEAEEHEQFEKIEFVSEGSGSDTDTDMDTDTEGEGSDATDVQRIEGKGKEREREVGFAEDSEEEEEFRFVTATATAGVDVGSTTTQEKEGEDVTALVNAEDPLDASLPTLTTSDDPPSPSLPSTSLPSSTTSEPTSTAPQPPTTASGLPPSLASFLSSLPQHASTLSTNLQTFLNHPSSDTLSALLSAPCEQMREVQTALNEVQSEVKVVVGEVLGNVRREARGLEEEFRRVRKEVERERERIRSQLGGGTDSMRSGGAEEAEAEAAEDKAGVQEDEGEEQQFEQKVAPQPEQPEQQQETLAAEHARLMAERNAEKTARHIAWDNRKKEREARQTRKLEAMKVRRGSKASRGVMKDAVEAASEQEVPALDDSTASIDPPIPVPVVEPIPSSTTATTTPNSTPLPSDDMYHRRISMVGSFGGPSPPSPPIASTCTSTPFTSRLPPSSFALQAPTPPTAPSFPHPFRPFDRRSGFAPSRSFVPGSFPTTPNPPPQPSTSTLPPCDPEVGWAEVTPTQLKKQLAELGFDLRQVGVRRVAERVWEEMRGKELGQMVEGCLEELGRE